MVAAERLRVENLLASLRHAAVLAQRKAQATFVMCGVRRPYPLHVCVGPYDICLSICNLQAQMQQLGATDGVTCTYLGQQDSAQLDKYEVNPEKWQHDPSRAKKKLYDVWFRWELPGRPHILQRVGAENAIRQGIPLQQFASTTLLHSLRQAAVAAAVKLGKEMMEQCGLQVYCECPCRTCPDLFPS